MIQLASNKYFPAAAERNLQHSFNGERIVSIVRNGPAQDFAAKETKISSYRPVTPGDVYRSSRSRQRVVIYRNEKAPSGASLIYPTCEFANEKRSATQRLGAQLQSFDMPRN